MARDGNIGGEHQPASTQRKEEAVRAAKMTGMDKSNGQDESQNNGENLTP